MVALGSSGIIGCVVRAIQRYIFRNPIILCGAPHALLQTDAHPDEMRTDNTTLIAPSAYCGDFIAGCVSVAFATTVGKPCQSMSTASNSPDSLPVKTYDLLAEQEVNLVFFVLVLVCNITIFYISYDLKLSGTRLFMLH